MKSFFFFEFVLCLLLFTKTHAQDTTTISADRPCMATSTYILPHGGLQAETGFSYEKANINNEVFENYMFNTTLLRYGISMYAEIRLQGDYVRVKSPQGKTDGFNPLILGSKVLVYEGSSNLPATAFLINLTLPYLGKKEFVPENITPSFYVLMENDIGENLNVCYNLGLEYSGGTPSPATFAALCLSYSFNDKLSGFIENYNGFVSNTSPENYLDLGCAYIVSNKFQFDFSGNFNVKDFKNYLMLNFGLSLKL